MLSPQIVRTHRSLLSELTQPNLFVSLRLTRAKERVKRDFLLPTVSCLSIPTLRERRVWTRPRFLNPSQFEIACSP